MAWIFLTIISSGHLFVAAASLAPSNPVLTTAARLSLALAAGPA